MPMPKMCSLKTLIYVFFFTSGVPALAYQLIWQRALFRVFGVNMESVTIVVTAFMLGLGIGSLIGSQLAIRRSFAPLLLIAVIEASIGAFGLCSLHLFDIANRFVQDLSLPVQIITAIGLVFIPTGLMGMTLPLLVGYLIRHSANVGLSTGSLYRANTLGAVIGCVVCALGFFPWFGLQMSIWAAAGVNGAVAIAAFVAFLLRGEENENIPEVEHEIPQFVSAGKVVSFQTSLGLAFFTGFVSLSYEIFLFRLVSFASGTSALALALTLAAFLLGVASGAQLAADWCADLKSDAGLPRNIFRLLLLNGILGLLILPILSLSAPFGNAILGVIMLLTFLIARSLGVIFPLLTHFAVRPDRRSGNRIGLVLLADILGAATGSMLTGFVLADVLGARYLAILLSLLSFAIVIPFIRLSTHGLKSLRMPLGASLAAASVLIAFQGPLSARVMESMLYKTQAKDLPPLARVVENRDGIIAVSPDGTVYGGGVYDGRFNIDPVHDTNGIIRPFGLSLYHSMPRDILMIGLASGSWGQVISNNPEVEHFTIVEINPGYIQMIRERPEVSSLLKNPKVQIVIDDGRRWLKRHPEQRFDAIMANTSYHFRANASNVLSVEFDNLIRTHLKQGGIYFFNTTGSERVERTGCRSFRYGYRVLNHLLVSDAPIDLDVNRWRRNLISYRIDGHPVFHMDRPADAAALQRILSLPAGANEVSPNADKRPMESCANVLARIGETPIVTDDNMGTEWRHPLGLE
jgi:spermidine synthase